MSTTAKWNETGRRRETDSEDDGKNRRESGNISSLTTGKLHYRPSKPTHFCRRTSGERED